MQGSKCLNVLTVYLSLYWYSRTKHRAQIYIIWYRRGRANFRKPGKATEFMRANIIMNRRHSIYIVRSVNVPLQRKKRSYLTPNHTDNEMYRRYYESPRDSQKSWARVAYVCRKVKWKVKIAVKRHLRIAILNEWIYLDKEWINHIAYFLVHSLAQSLYLLMSVL